MVYNFNLIVPLGLNNFDIGVLDIVNAKELSFNSNLVPVVNSADVEAFEVADSLRVAHPEGAVVRFAFGELRPNLRVAH